MGIRRTAATHARVSYALSPATVIRRVVSGNSPSDRDRGVAFGGPARLGDRRVDDEPVAIFGQQMPEISQLGLATDRLLVQPRPRLQQRAIDGECSSDSRPSCLMAASTSAKNASAMSPGSSRSRFFVNVVGSQIGSCRVACCTSSTHGLWTLEMA